MFAKYREDTFPVKKASIFLRYVIPAAMVGGLVASCLLISFRPLRQNEETLGLVRFPHGQCLVAVVEPDGVYLGNERIPIEQFGAVFDAVYRKQRLDWAMVLGSPKSRYGDTVEVYAKLYQVFGDRITLVTDPVRSGRRWNAVEPLGRWGWLSDGSVE